MATDGGIDRVGSGVASYAVTDVTDATGSIVVNFPVGRFSDAPVMSAMLQGSSLTRMYMIQITTISATAAVIKVTMSNPAVLGAPTNAVGETVHIQAQLAG